MRMVSSTLAAAMLALVAAAPAAQAERGIRGSQGSDGAGFVQVRGGHGHHHHHGRHFGGHGHRFHHFRHHHGFHHYPAWGVGIGLGLAWPYWGWGWHAPVIVEAPVGIVERRIYVNPQPMPRYGEPPFRWYCAPASAYYPDVRECSQPWMKVLPSDRDRDAAPPVRRDGGSPTDRAPADRAPASSSPEAAPPGAPRSMGSEPYAPASSGSGWVAAPRLAPPAASAVPLTPVVAYERYASP